MTPELERQLSAPRPHRLEGRFAWRPAGGAPVIAHLPDGEARLLASFGEEPRPLAALLTQQVHLPLFERLRARGLLQMSAFTPTDAAYVTGAQSGWDEVASRLGAALLARKRDGGGRDLAPTIEAMAEKVLAAVRRRAAETVLETAFFASGHDGKALMASALAQQALDGMGGPARVTLTLDRPVIGLGASAGLHFSGLEQAVGQKLIVPEHAGVANAVGAVAGQVRLRAEAMVTALPSGRFRVSTGNDSRETASEADAMEAARQLASDEAMSLSLAAGAASVEVTRDEEVVATIIEGQRFFVSATVTATAAGRPRIAGQ